MNQKLYDQILTKIKNHNINDEYKLTDDANGIWDAIETIGFNKSEMDYETEKKVCGLSDLIESIGFNKTKDDYKTEMKVFEDIN